MKTDITHKSKIGFAILIPTIVIPGIAMALMIVNGIWPGMLICGLVIMFVVSIYMTTIYTITTDHRLIIKCGIFARFEIDIHTIESIKETNELTNAPALSVDRLEINYSGGRVLVSPKNKMRFIDDLRMVNSNILVNNSVYKVTADN